MDIMDWQEEKVVGSQSRETWILRRSENDRMRLMYFGDDQTKKVEGQQEKRKTKHKMDWLNKETLRLQDLRMTWEW